MFRKKHTLNLYQINQIIDNLEHKKNLAEKTLDINLSEPLKTTKHHNTYILQALAWNCTKATMQLLALDKNKTAINLADEWPTCKNTPIILAAKINATAIVQKLIQLGADVNAKDYRGFTALHYACLMRNQDLITQLLDAKADANSFDDFGNAPIHYYQMSITQDDLAYRYGKGKTDLIEMPDLNRHYFGTKKHCLSALRWFLPHIIVNNQLGQEIELALSDGKKTLFESAENQLKRREPVYNLKIYEALTLEFCRDRDHKLRLESVNLKRLEPITQEGYNCHDVLDFASKQSVKKVGGKFWIELVSKDEDENQSIYSGISPARR